MKSSNTITYAETKDFPSVYALFKDVCDAQKDGYNTYWNMEIYPQAEDLKNHIDNHEMYLFRQDEKIAAAMVIADDETEEYCKADWKVQAAGDEVCYLLLLAVHPKFRGQHIAYELMRYMIEAARRDGKKALRLAVVRGNLAAEQLYRKTGFQYITEYTVHYEFTGEVIFNIFELDLKT